MTQTFSGRGSLVAPAAALLLCISSFAFSGDMDGKAMGRIIQDTGRREPWEMNSVGFSTSYLSKITNVTPLDYSLMSSVLTFKLPLMRKWEFAGGDLILRTRIDLIYDYFIEGAENYYFGFSGSPSFEWWNKSRNYSLFFSVGGGFGVVDTHTSVIGGQGQDFTFNWFAHLGAQHRIKEHLFLHYGVFFHHLSNRNQHPVNPGLNTIGPMIGLTYEF